MASKPTRLAAAVGLLAPAAAALGVAGAQAQAVDNRLPRGIDALASWIEYDGESDDLLTAGLGASGLASATPPAFADPNFPTAAELRRLAIYNNYRALIDTTSGGGYGRIYGPNIDAEGNDTGTEGLIAGTEVLAFATTGARGANFAGSRPNVTMMVQVPESFDPAAPCIVTGPSSGSRGVYGAIATSGEWGLKNGCAVAYTDKGGGTGAHDLGDDTVGLIDGAREDADAAGRDSTFTAPLNDRARERFDARTPDRFAFKHAHSKLNPEARWGANVLTSIELAFYVLNELCADGTLDCADAIAPENTVVIASSISNGGGSSVLAAEQDRAGLIDGIAVSEPNVNPRFDEGFTIVEGEGEPFADHSRPLNEYYAVLNLYLGCASVAFAADDPTVPLNLAASPERCESLAELGLVEGETLEAQAASAQAAINAFGFLEEQNTLAPSHWFLNVPQAIGPTYANAYGRFGVEENVCGYSFGATDAATGAPVALADTAEAALFATSNGIPPTGGVNLINNDSADGPVLDRLSVSPTTGRADQNIDGHLCLFRLAFGLDAATGEPITGPDLGRHRRIQRGIAQILATGDLGGLPAIFVTGRADAILPPNHTSRGYYGLNQRVEGAESNLAYVEILNAQHLDVLNGIAGFDSQYVPLHHYFILALDRMLDHLRNGTALPPSQVVRTIPREVGMDGTVAPITIADNLPDIADTPAAGDLITFEEDEVRIPE